MSIYRITLDDGQHAIWFVAASTTHAIGMLSKMTGDPVTEFGDAKIKALTRDEASALLREHLDYDVGPQDVRAWVAAREAGYLSEVML